MLYLKKWQILACAAAAIIVVIFIVMLLIMLGSKPNIGTGNTASLSQSGAGADMIGQGGFASDTDDQSALSSEGVNSEASQTLTSSDAGKNPSPSGSYEKPPSDTTEVDVKEQGIVGDGKTDNSAAIQSIISKYQDYVRISFPAGEYLIGSNLTVPSNIILELADGASLRIASGKTLTVKGFVEAPISHIFTGSGNVAGKIRGFGYPQWFGAKGNRAVDDSQAFIKAVSALAYVKVPYASQYLIGADITIESPVVIEGIGAKQVDIYVTSSVSKLFCIQSNDVEIKNFMCYGHSSPSAAILYFDTAKGSIKNVSLSNISGIRFGSLLKDAASGKGKVTSVTANSLRIDASQAAGVELSDFDSDIVLNDILVNNLGAGTYVGGARFIVRNCNGMKLWNVDVAGNYSGIGSQYSASGDGFYFRNCSDITINRLMADAVGGYCVKIENSRKITIESSVVSLFDKGGFYFNNVTNSVVKNCKVNNDPVASTYTQGDNGVVFTTGSNHNTIDNLLIQGIRKDGLRINHSGDNTFTGVVIADCQGRAYVEEGETSNRNKFYGLACSGNTNAVNLVQVGANSAVYGLNDKSGGFTAVISGAATK